MQGLTAHYNHVRPSYGNYSTYGNHSLNHHHNTAAHHCPCHTDQSQINPMLFILNDLMNAMGSLSGGWGGFAGGAAPATAPVNAGNGGEVRPSGGQTRVRRKRVRRRRRRQLRSTNTGITGPGFETVKPRANQLLQMSAEHGGHSGAE